MDAQLKEKTSTAPESCCPKAPLSDMQSVPSCCCGVDDRTVPPTLRQTFVVGTVGTPMGEVPLVSASLMTADRWGGIKARWKVGRMNYRVQPGLYAMGSPNEDSPVMVTANYKMSFDFLRRELAGRNTWIMVLDTGGINVWCAAGKGTFGTVELVNRIETCGLSKVVKHRTVILPQLGAAGVAAHQVLRGSGFRVVYGPVRAKDLPAFLDNGLKATAKMREKTFTVRERIVLIPVELVAALPKSLIVLPGFFLVGGMLGPGPFRTTAAAHGILAAWAVLCTVLAGAVLTPILLPWLPGRAFSIKGLWAGLLTAALLVGFTWPDAAAPSQRLEILAWVLMISAGAAFLGMNFTGSSTITSLSGVKKEMRWAVPVEIAAVVSGLGLWAGSLLLA